MALLSGKTCTYQKILIIGELTEKKKVRLYMSFMIMHDMGILKM